MNKNLYFSQLFVTGFFFDTGVVTIILIVFSRFNRGISFNETDAGIGRISFKLSLGAAAAISGSTTLGFRPCLGVSESV